MQTHIITDALKRITKKNSMEPESSKDVEPCKQLWREVLKISVHDALMRCDTVKGKNNNVRTINTINKSSAINFLKINNKRFRFICSLAGYEPDYVIREYKKRLEAKIKLDNKFGRGN